MHLVAQLTAAAALGALLYVPGWAVARALRVEADLFARLWCGMATVSVAGLALAQARRFSLPALLAVIGAVALGGALIARRRGSAGPGPEERESERARAARRIRVLAGAAGLAAIVWCWPPFETIIAGADSTMYLNAGIYLARSGTLVVTDTVGPVLPATVARGMFPSVSVLGIGPYIRLPGGLLMADLSGGRAVPAFFPLLPVWVAIEVLLAGPAAAPAVAPLFAGLSVWSVVLFAGETLGLATAAISAAFLLANFGLWWFGRFAMSETLTLAFLWGGLVFVARAARLRTGGASEGRTAPDDAAPAAWSSAASALAAGVMLGIAGLARTETFVVLLAAGALWRAWAPARAPLAPLVLGFAAPLAFGAAILAAAPSHHLAYLRNDLAFRTFLVMPRLVAAQADGRLAALALLLPALVLGAGLFAYGVRGRFLVGTARAATLLVTAGAVLAYAQVIGSAPGRHVAWLAAYCSWPLLVLAPPGIVALWRRGGVAAQLAVALVGVVAAFFLANPRVAAYQPWAIRRFLPIVIPGLTIAGAGALALVARSSRPALKLAALLAVGTIVLLEVRPIRALRGARFFAGSFEAVARLAATTPPDAVIGINSRFADVQLQVPLWLAYGRETLMSDGRSLAWREAMSMLVASRRPIFWIGDRYDQTPAAPGLRFRVVDDAEIAIPLPDAPARVPPARTVTRIVPARIYSVEPAFGVAAGETSGSGVGVR